MHGSPLMECSSAFESQEYSEKTAAALGRVLLLDLLIRNEDRLPCRQLRWRGNSANLLLADKTASANMDALEETYDSAIKRSRPRVVGVLPKERRATSVDSRLSLLNSGLVSQASGLSDIMESPKSSERSLRSQSSDLSFCSDVHIVAIDSGVPRRPPAGKRANDQANYPKLVELLLNSSEYSSNLLYDISGGKLGSPPSEDTNVASDPWTNEMTSIAHEFRNGFRAALRDLQGFQIFMLTLHQKLECLLRAFLNILNKISSGESDKEDLVVPGSPSSKERFINDPEFIESELQRTSSKSSSSGNKESSGSSSPVTRENWHGKSHKGSGEPVRSLRLTAKLRDFQKFAKVGYTLLAN